MTTEVAPRTQATGLSMVCIQGVPAFLGTGPDEKEYFIPGLGRGNRRPVRPGDHLDPAHPLVLAHPECFRDSWEPAVDAVGVYTSEALELRQAQQERLDARHAVKYTPCCARCGEEHDESVVLLPMPTDLALNDALTTVEATDRAGKWRIETMHEAAKMDAIERQLEADRIDAEWRAKHPTCRPGTPPAPEPQIPDNPPMFFRRSEIRSAA